MQITPEDRLCLFFPLFHMFGNTCICLSGLIRGAALSIPSDQFSPPEVLSALTREQCPAIYGSPSMFLAILEASRFEGFQPGNLRTGIVGGAPFPLALMERIVAEIGVRELAIAYGITEASSWVTQTPPDDPLDLRVSTIGKALPNSEVKIVEPLTGEDLPDGQSGEICTRGFLMKGYFKNPEATARVIDRDGWYHTGDLGTRDAQGYFRITGRLKDKKRYRIRGNNSSLIHAPSGPAPERVGAAWPPRSIAAFFDPAYSSYPLIHIPLNDWSRESSPIRTPAS